MRKMRALLWTSGGSFLFECFKWLYQGADYSERAAGGAGPSRARGRSWAVRAWARCGRGPAGAAGLAGRGGPRLGRLRFPAAPPAALCRRLPYQTSRGLPY